MELKVMTFEDILDSLVGLEFSGSSRAANMECFKLGNHTKVGKKIYDEYFTPAFNKLGKQINNVEMGLRNGRLPF